MHCDSHWMVECPATRAFVHNLLCCLLFYLSLSLALSLSLSLKREGEHYMHSELEGKAIQVR